MKKLRFLAWLLVCTLFLQPITPVFSPNAAAAGESELTFNGGYPYGKEMTADSVTLVAPIEGSGTKIQWYQSTAKDGEYQPISGATGKEYKPNFNDKSCYPDGPDIMAGDNKTLIYRAYENGTLAPDKCPKNWYKCTVNGQWSKPVQLLQAVQVSCFHEYCSGINDCITHVHSVDQARQKLYQIAAIRVKNSDPLNQKGESYKHCSYWYISNGYAAYTVYPKQAAGKDERTYQAFDVIGRFKHRSATQNYHYYWLGESHSANMAFDTDNYTDLRLRFDDNDEYHKRVLVDVDLPAGQDKIALAFYPRLGEWKMFSHNSAAYTMQFSGLISAVNTFGSTWGSSFSGIDRLTGIQMVGSTSLRSGVFLDTPAWNITFEESSKPSSFWLGNYDSKMYQDSHVYNAADGGWYDPAKYVHNFNTIKYTGIKATEETSNLKGQSDPIVTSVQCKNGENGMPSVYPRTAISWSGVGGKTVTFGIAAGTVVDAKAYIPTLAKCPIEIGGKPVIWMNDYGPDGQGYTYDGEPIELKKENTKVATKHEPTFTTAEVIKLLDVVSDLDYTFYKADGSWTQKPPSGMRVGEKLDGIPIDSDDYYLIVSVPASNPYFTGEAKFFVRVFAKPIPVYNLVPLDKNYDGKTTVRWNSRNVQWGDNSREEYKVYSRDHPDNWYVLEVKAEFQDATVGDNKIIVGLMGKDGKREDIDIIHCSGTPRDDPDRHWRNYVPYFPKEPTASILKVPADTENALAPPEAEVIAATSITLEGFPTNGGQVQYAKKTPNPDLTDPADIAADLAAAPTDDSAWQDSPVFTGLEKGKKYYFYLRLTGDASFEDHVVTSKGAAISTSTESAQVRLQNPVNSLEYNGSPVVPQLKFAAGSATCLEEAVEYTWSAKVQSNIVPLDGPPKDVGSYQVEVSIRPEYSDDYTILGENTFTFDITSKWIWGIPSNLFTAVDRVYDGTGKATLSYNEEELRRAIESEMAPGDTTRGMVVVASGQFSQWNASYNVTIEPEQAYENKPVSVNIRMLGPGANNYLVSYFGGTLTATIFKADRTIAAPGVASDDGGNITLDIPGVTGVDDTAGTDGVISYAVADTDQAPDAASALWQTSPDFSVLADGSEYYLFARITGGKNYHDAVSPGALYVSSLSHSHNWDSSNWTTDATAHWHECQAEDCPIKDNAKKNGYGLHRFTQWAQDPDTGGKSRTCQDCGYHESTYLPMSQISMGTWTWTKTYYDQPDPLLSNLKTPTLQIFAMDRDEDLVSLGYVCMATPSDPAQFAESAWHLLPMESDQTGTLSEEVVIPESLLSGGYVYVRAKDAAGNVHYASTPKLVFDTVAPKIKIDGVDVTSGQTYCTPQTAAVSDDLELASVTLDGKDIAAMGAIRLEAGEHTLVAVDKAGNRATVTVRVNNGHTNKEWSIPPSCVDVGITITTCTVCGYTTTTPDAPQGHTWDREYTVDREPTCTEQGVKSLHCTKCGAGKEFQTIPAVGHTLEPDWHKGASHHWQICSTCGERVNEMSHQGTGLWIRETGRAAGAGVEEHMECAVCHAIITRRYQPYSDDPYVQYGTVEKQTEVKPGAPEAQWSDSLDAALKAVGFEETDLTEYNNAVSHKLVLSISPLAEGTAIPGQTEIQQTAETQLKRKDAEFLYVDVSLLKYTYKENGGNVDDTPELIHQTEKPLEIMLQIPEELQTIPEGMTRTFFLLYAHEQNGKMESAILEPHKNSGNGKLYFSTDRFSTYAIAYVDTPVGEDPPSVITPTPTPTSKPTPPSPSIPISPSTPTSRPTSTPSPAPSSDPSVDHIDYIHGHKGQFRPNDYMSRAEAAQILYRLLADKPQVELAFDDVSEAAWYSEAVSVLAGLGIVKGIGNHRFDPERPVTRGEFAAMAARFMDLPLSEGQSSFPDVPDGAWYSGSVNACESAGWIKGYPDGLFRPMDRITRAQAVTIVNRMLKRAADEQAVAKRTMPFSDVPRTHWAYDDILEAAVAHKSVIQSDGSEIWE